MDILHKIFLLMEQQNMNASALSKEIGISSGLISQWKKGLQKPSLEVAAKIADYFNVSVDYLLGRTDNPEINK